MNLSIINSIYTFAVIVFFTSQISAQNIIVQPYLQDASPTSISILWETDSEEESIVEWGLTDTLGNTTSGINYTSNGSAKVHEVTLDNLNKFTKYFYRVRTLNAISSLFHFKTPPFASDHEPFRIVAMSDMQHDNSHPNKFQEIVEDGILDYLEEEIGGDIVDNLALIMIPGDLVDNGNNYNQWKNTFFDPAKELFSYVPVYPVLGNHENNTAYYFTYFKLPENGSAGLDEHWWHKDYGNVRIIGMNSNSPFDNAFQLLWLDEVLASTCSADSIDFVFAQLHHPHKSELWTPGESNFTGDVIDRLEQFSTNCNKPSIHFFGHTHGYSRGQSRDHKHLWINVATAGGAIDNWGEFPNFDYDEFSVSQDEYGFVMVEITNDADPKLIIKRISRGDQDLIIDNKLTDSLTIRLNHSVVNIPTAIFPVNEEISPECVTLVANNFSAPNINSTHGQSHWQVATSQNDFSTLVAESWKNFENWYYDIDTQADDDLRDEKIIGLDELSTYWWRVRYRDKEMNWSDWSSPVTFTTGESIALPNLIVNPGAEDNLNNWVTTQGVVEALTSGECQGIAPNSGNKYFAVGGLCYHSDIGISIQNIDISAYIDSINSGTFRANFGGYLSNYSGSDHPEMKLIFLDENDFEIGQSNTLSTLNDSWTLLMDTAIIPALTRTIQINLKGTRNAGTDNDSYFDDLFLTLGEILECNDIISNTTNISPTVNKLKIAPNPMSFYTTIKIPEHTTSNFLLNMIDSKGNKVKPFYRIDKDVIVLGRGNLSKGIYYIWVEDENHKISSGEIIILGD